MDEALPKEAKNYVYISEKSGDIVCSAEDISLVEPPRAQRENRSAGNQECGEILNTYSTVGPSTDICTSIARLNAFLSDLERKDAECNQRWLNEKIQAHVCYQVSYLFAKQAEKHPENFRNRILHLVGSVGEDTKVGLYDEFDFVIELGALKQHACEYLRNGGNNHEKRKEMCDQVLSSLPPCWKSLRYTHDQVHSKNILLRLQIPALDEPVYCDIVLATPELKVSRKSCSRTEASVTSGVYILKPNNGYEYVQSYVFEETKKLVNPVMSDDVKRVYRVTKLLIRDFLPLQCDLEKATFGPLVKSYCLKQIILNMMNEFPEPVLWREEYFGLRVIQAIYSFQKGDFKGYYNFTYEPLYQQWPFVQNYVKHLYELLVKASLGDDRAFILLASLHHVNLRFKECVRNDMLRRCITGMINNYTRYRNEGKQDCRDLSILQDYIKTYTQGAVNLLEVNNQIQIVYNDKIYSVGDFLCGNFRYDHWM